MSSLVEALYPLPDLRRTPLSTLRWWESRRLSFNLTVGAAGLTTISVLYLLSMILPWWGPLRLVEALPAVAAYAVMANVCYSLGWLSELVARLAWGPRAPHMGPLLYRQGLIFSVGLTLLPILLMGFAAVAGSVARLLGLG